MQQQSIKMESRHQQSAVNPMAKSPLFLRSSAASSLQLQQTIGNHGVLRISGPIIQPKLMIGPPKDKYEREADRVADLVIRIPNPQPLQKGRIDFGGITELDKWRIRGDEKLRLQRRYKDQTELSSASSIVEDVLRSPGKSLNAPTRAFIGHLLGGGKPLSDSARAYFEPRFGHDFSRVRVHTGGLAAVTATGINSRAFAIGTDIAFAPGQYAPNTSVGRRLLAHELTHAIQQGLGFSPQTSFGNRQRLASVDRQVIQPTRIPEILLQRKVYFREGEIFSILNEAKYFVEDRRFTYSGIVIPLLNDSEFLDLGVREPLLGRRILSDGTEEVWVREVPHNTGSNRMYIPTPGPWLWIADDFLGLRELVTKYGHEGCEPEGLYPNQVLVRLEGQPTTEQYRREVEAHEERHALDNEKAFYIAFKQWDANLKNAKDEGTRFLGGELVLYPKMGGRPRDVALRYDRLTLEYGDEFHRTPEGEKRSKVHDFHWYDDCAELHGKIKRDIGF